MAVVKGNLVKRGKTAKARAKATIRYLLHRPGTDRARTTRALFGADGVMSKQQAYRMIDAAKQDTDLAPQNRTRNKVCHAAAAMSISAWA